MKTTITSSVFTLVCKAQEVNLQGFNAFQKFTVKFLIAATFVCGIAIFLANEIWQLDIIHNLFLYGIAIVVIHFLHLSIDRFYSAEELKSLNAWSRFRNKARRTHEFKRVYNKIIQGIDPALSYELECLKMRYQEFQTKQDRIRRHRLYEARLAEFNAIHYSG